MKLLDFLFVISLIAWTGCGGVMIEPPDASIGDEAASEPGPCSVLHSWNACLQQSDASCSWGGPDKCASLGDGAPPLPVPESEIIHFDAGGCFPAQLCGPDDEPLHGPCPSGQTCRYVAIGDCTTSGPCDLNWPYDVCHYLHVCAGPNGP